MVSMNRGFTDRAETSETTSVVVVCDWCVTDSRPTGLHADSVVIGWMLSESERSV